MPKAKKKKKQILPLVSSSKPELVKHLTLLDLHLVSLAIDIWKLGNRIRSENESERVLAALERLESTLTGCGIRIDSMVGDPYDTNMSAVVLDHIDSDNPLFVAECISPAVYMNNELVHSAEIVTKGAIQ